MRTKALAFAGLIAVCPSWVAAQTSVAVSDPVRIEANQTLTLEHAWALAERGNPVLNAARARMAAAQGALTDAAAPLYNNPELTLERTRRAVPQSGSPDQRRNEWNVGLAQTIEIAGQRGHRLAVNEAAVVALEAEIEDQTRKLRSSVAQAFNRVLALQQRIALDEEALELFERTALAVEKRRAAGEDTRLDANVAAVEAERARHQLAQSREQLIEARAELGAVLQLPPDVAPQVRGDLSARAGVAIDLSALLNAVESQPRLRAHVARQQSAEARLRLEEASRYPDVTVGVSVGREGPGDARERLTTFSVSVPLPLFKRNASGIGQARSELGQARIERDAAVRDVRAQVRASWARLQSLQARVERLQNTVLPALLENQQLSLKSQRAGQIGLLELIVVNRQALDARRDLIDALAELQDLRQALEALAGQIKQGIQP